MSEHTPRVQAGAGERSYTVPGDVAVLPLRDTVLFPNSFMPLAVARESSVALIGDAIAGAKVIGVFTQKDPTLEEPGQSDLHTVGTLTHIHKMFKLPDGSLRLIVQGLSRISLDRITAQQAVPARRSPRSGRRAAGCGRARDQRARAEHPGELQPGRSALARALGRPQRAGGQHHRRRAVD